MPRKATKARAEKIAQDFRANSNWATFIWAVSDAAGYFGSRNRVSRFAFTEELVKALEGETCHNCNYESVCEVTGDLVHWCKAFTYRKN